MAEINSYACAKGDAAGSWDVKSDSMRNLPCTSQSTEKKVITIKHRKRSMNFYLTFEIILLRSSFKIFY